MEPATPPEHVCSPVFLFLDLHLAEALSQKYAAGMVQVMVVFNENGGFGHYWCEVTADGMTFYIDIAAEQFGYSSFIVKNAHDLSGWPRYIPGDQATVDEHVRLAYTEGIQ